MIQLVHNDDGKQKYQSHEVYCKEADFYFADKDLYSRNPFEVVGYGATKNEALQEFIRKMDWVMKEWQDFCKSLNENLEIREVDCMGNYIYNKKE